MRKLALVLFALFVVALAAAPRTAQADDTENWHCQPGQFLTGFAGSKGAWLDNLAPVCGTWTNDGIQNAVPPNVLFGSRAADTNVFDMPSERCGQNEAVTALRFGLATPDDERHLQNLQIQCASVITHITSGWHAELVSDGGSPSGNAECTGANTAANGFAISLNGNAITGLGLDCIIVSQVMADAMAASAAATAAANALLPPLAAYGINRPGYDVDAPIANTQQFASDTAGAQHCYQTCKTLSYCQAWSYGLDPGTGYSPRCHIKDRVPAAQKDSHFISGIMPPARSSLNTDRPGSDIANLPLADTDPNLCAAACAANSQCRAWTYTNPGVNGSSGPHCYLKNPAPAPVSGRSCCVSGDILRVAGGSVGSANLGGAPSAMGTGSGASKLGGRFGQATASIGAGGSSAPIVQTLSAKCTSAGEACNVPAALNLPAGTWSVKVAAPTSHCSPIDYRLTTDNHGDLIGDSGALAPGAASGVMIVPPSAHQIYVSATGIAGGCNKGSLASWSVVVTLTPR